MMYEVIHSLAQDIVDCDRIPHSSIPVDCDRIPHSSNRLGECCRVGFAPDMFRARQNPIDQDIGSLLEEARQSSADCLFADNDSK